MDLTARTKVAFVVERYGMEEPTEAGRRTRAMANAMAARGHDVTVLTTCARRLDDWRNEMAEGQGTLEDIRLVRFRVAHSGLPRVAKTAGALMTLHPAAGLVWSNAVGPVSVGYRRHLDRLGHLFDAVFFCGAWGYLVTEGVRRVRNAVLCPPPCDDPTRKHGHAKALLRAARAVAVATPDERDLLTAQTGHAWRCPTFLVGACPEPPGKERRRGARLVDGPYLVQVGPHGPSTEHLLESFRFFRDAHGSTSFEDDDGGWFEGRDVRLVLAGDFAHPHQPNAGVLALGPVDDENRALLVQQSLGYVHADPSVRIPAGLLEAWTLGKATLVRGKSAVLAPILERAGGEYTYDSPPTFASSAASMLSRRDPRSAFGARAAEICRRLFSQAKLASALEDVVRGAVGRATGVISELPPAA
jgi:hypothetical protein